MSLGCLVVIAVQAWIERSYDTQNMQYSTSEGTCRKNICSMVIEQPSIEEESPASLLANIVRGSEPHQYLPCDGADFFPEVGSSAAEILRRKSEGVSNIYCFSLGRTDWSLANEAQSLCRSVLDFNIGQEHFVPSSWSLYNQSN